VAKARAIPGLVGTSRFRDAAAAAVEVRAAELFSFATGVLDTADIERVHDMRVASRRLRAVMEMFAPCFPKREHRQGLRELKALADALGGRRDADVAMAALERVGSALTAADGPGIESIEAELRQEQEHANAELGRALEEAEAAGLHERLLALAAEARAR
jgi:CHAD domain-containing protein